MRGMEARWKFPRPFPGRLRFVGVVNGFASCFVEGTWERKGQAYRRLSAKGETLVVPTHVLQDKGVYYEYAILDDPREGQTLLYWARLAH